MKVLTVFGTRPEAIKLAPVLKALEAAPEVESRVCVTGQHRQMLDPVLSLFGIVPDRDLALMGRVAGLNGLMAGAIGALDEVLETERPDRVLVHGDTTTALAGAIAAFHRNIPVAHVEAGLRTGDLARPWPEEMNRRCVDAMADWLFPPTRRADDALIGEGLGDRRRLITGNTVLDALALAERAIDRGVQRDAIAKLEARLSPCRRLVLVTGHRRESFGAGVDGICDALLRLSERPEIEIVYPVHLNPHIRGPVSERLSGRARVHLVPPLEYLPFVWLMRRADVILTDSGGVQEEAPSLGTPVLVMRETTERPEAVDAGTARLVGVNAERIEGEVLRLFRAGSGLRPGANPYGDGRAAERIVSALLGRFCNSFGAEDDVDGVPAAMGA